MFKRTPFLFTLLFSLAILSACGQKEIVPVDTAEPVAQVEPAQKMAADATELTYEGPAQFVSEPKSFPCSEAAYDNDICMKDPEATVSFEAYFLRLQVKDLNSELLSYLDQQSESMVEKTDESYELNLGCKSEGEIHGDLYSYESDLIDAAFETGEVLTVDLTIGLGGNPRHGDYTSCISPITQFAIK